MKVPHGLKVSLLIQHSAEVGAVAIGAAAVLGRSDQLHQAGAALVELPHQAARREGESMSVSEELLVFARAVQDMRRAQLSAKHPNGAVTRAALRHVESVVDGMVEHYMNAPIPVPPVPPLGPDEMREPGE